MSTADLQIIADRLDRIEQAIAYRPDWIAGYANLGRYIGRQDKKGRIAKAFSEQENLTIKKINGVPHFSRVEVDRAMRNGRPIETR